jgi:flagellar protein FlaJ
MAFFKKLSRSFPGLKAKLQQAGILDEPEDYLKKMGVMSFFASFGFSLLIFIVTLSLLIALAILIVVTPLLFMYLIKYVDVKKEQVRKDIDQEIVFAGRYLMIEISAGVPMHTAFENVHRNYDVVGVYFGEIVSKIYLGTSMDDAINEVLIMSPSPNLRRVLWQLLNSIKTGSDVGPSLEVVINQIVKEQQVSVKEYGRKLNPLAMFYMMVAIIMPSLGTVMLVVMSTFLGLNISLVILLAIAGLVGFVQFMFLSIIKSSRPPISAQ